MKHQYNISCPIWEPNPGSQKASAMVKTSPQEYMVVVITNHYFVEYVKYDIDMRPSCLYEYDNLLVPEARDVGFVP